MAKQDLLRIGFLACSIGVLGCLAACSDDGEDGSSSGETGTSSGGASSGGASSGGASSGGASSGGGGTSSSSSSSGGSSSGGSSSSGDAGAGSLDAQCDEEADCSEEANVEFDVADCKADHAQGRDDAVTAGCENEYDAFAGCISGLVFTCAEYLGDGKQTRVQTECSTEGNAYSRCLD